MNSNKLNEVNEVKSFVDYLVERKKINTKKVRCIRTLGSGNKAVLKVEYDGYCEDYRPVALAKRYLQETYGFYPKHLNFCNPTYDRICSSVLTVYRMSREDYDRYCSLPSIYWAVIHTPEGWGQIGFLIQNERQEALSYKRRLYEYFD
ncbi:MAG: hypothetical protein LBE91_02560 [Tannerella sp.]|nr:hypothetical protein [Tannerella sp.]